MRLKSLLLFCSVFILTAFAAFADSPMEAYHFSCKEIKPAVLLDTIGVLTINASWSWEPTYHVDDVQIPLVEKNEALFISAGEISLQKDTRCLTSYGYAGTGSFRFPVTENSGDYCRIVIDPKEDRRVWIDRKKLAGALANGLEFCLFESLQDVKVDLFFFTSSRKKKIYNEPVKNSASRVIDDKAYPVLEAAETKNGFVRLVVFEGDPGVNTEKKTVGWARIRDNDGLLSIWIIDCDEC